MKEKEILALLQAGTILGIVEFRSSSARAYTAQAKDGKQASRTVQLVHKCEKGDIQLEISEKLDEAEAAKFDLVGYNNGPKPFKKGERVLWHVKSFGWTGDGKAMKLRASGHLEKLEP